MTILPQTSTPETAQKFPLVPIHQENGELWVDARTLHAALQVGRDFGTWIQGRIEEVDAQEGSEFIVLENSPVSGKTPGGRPRRDYWLSLDLAKEIAMLERNEIGKAIRRYFIQAEKELRARPALAAPTYPEALRQLADTLEAKAQAEAQLALAAPKVKAFEQFMDSSSTYLVREAAKMLGIGQNRLYTFMRLAGIIIPGTCEPYQKHIDAGHFEVKTTPYMRGDKQATSKTTYVTTRGLEYLRRKLTEVGEAA